MLGVQVIHQQLTPHSALRRLTVKMLTQSSRGIAKENRNNNISLFSASYALGQRLLTPYKGE